MNTFQLKIVTPELELYNKNCYQVDLPGSDGRFGVLPNHMNMISSLSPGIVEIYEDEDRPTLKLVIADGFVNIKSGECIVLVEKGVEFSKINVNEFTSNLAALKLQIESAKSEIEIKIIKNKIDYLNIALENITS